MTTFVEATEMTDYENSNIARKVRELGADIEKIEFRNIDRIGPEILFEPDFQVSTNPLDHKGWGKCTCFYGGERMECFEKCGRQKGEPDTYFRIDDPEGKKIDRDVYSDCIVRKLAKKLIEAYRQGEETS